MTVATKAPRTASSHSSPSLSPIDEANIFEDSLFESPDNSDSDTTDTDSTLSDVEQCSPDFGHPLERMERTELSVGGLDLSLQEGTSKLGFDAHEVENIQRFVDAAAIGSMGTGLYSLTGQAYESPTRNSSTSNLSIRLNSYYFVTDSYASSTLFMRSSLTVFYRDFEKVVDLWASKHLNARQSIPTDMVRDAFRTTLNSIQIT
ncbi:hypothetical protein BDN72DRAFT_609405 [Pluteus cervinus]|uniref:Uncharacterized protein n=1 Tax=Pluteus cervinus TaxID=181527 RepID=A0ACD3AUW5_9AGAR|nr:hypothetical protein BDN72DRAFT_609405 [Pluteus cervinus]